MFDVDDLKNSLESMEEKIRTSSSSSLSKEEVRLLNCIMVFSDKLRKLTTEDTDLCCTIAGDSKERVTLSADSNLSFICDYCDQEVSLLNNDPEFSFRMHKQSKEHTDVIDRLALLSVQDEEKMSSEIVIPGCEIQLVSDVPDWLEIRKNGQEYCSLCERFLPHKNLVTHFSGFRHQRITLLKKVFGPDTKLASPGKKAFNVDKSVLKFYNDESV